MSDARFRHLERGASAEDAAAVLRHRIRTGELDERRVALAGFLGYEPALLASEPVRLNVPSYAAKWSRVRGVLRFGGLDQRLLVTLAADFAERVPQGPEGRVAITAARAWVACPCPDHAAAAQAARAAAWAAAWAAESAAAAPAAAGAAAAWAAAAAEEAAEAAAWAAAQAATAADAAAARAAEEVWQAEHMALVLCWGTV
jgi:hypothetical protein